MKRLNLSKMSIRLPLIIVSMQILTIVASTFLVASLGRDAMKRQTFASNTKAVEIYASAVQSYLDQARTVLEITAKDDELLDAFERLSQESSSTSGNDVMAVSQMTYNIKTEALMRQVIGSSEEFEYAALLRRDGTLLQSEPHNLDVGVPQQNWQFLRWYWITLAAQTTIISDLHISPLTNRPSVVIATPIRSSDGRIAGIWVGGLRLAKLSEIGQTANIKESHDSFGYITDSQGRIVAHHGDLKYGEYQTDYSTVPSVISALAGKSGVMEYQSPIEDRPELAAYTALRSTRWAVIYAMPTEIAYAPVTLLTNNIVYAGLAILVLMGIVAVLIGGRFVKPVHQLVKVAERMRDGDYSVPIGTVQTEEIQQLAKTFECLRTTVCEKEHQLKQHAEHLELRVKERTLALESEIAERQKVEMALVENQRRLATLLDHLPGMVFRCAANAQRTIEYMSKGCLELTGHQPDQFVGNEVLSYYDIIHPNDRERVSSEISDAIERIGSYIIEYRILKKDGREKWVWEKGGGVKNSFGKVVSLEGLIIDISERKRLESALQQRYHEARAQAERDTLTGLFNHKTIHQKLESVLENAKKEHTPIAVLMMDVDKFKRFNDTYGHPFGDRVIKQVAHVLEKCTRGSDIIGRYGGDEFVAVLPDTSYELAVVMAERVQTRLAEDSHLIIDKTNLPIRISFGIAVYPEDGQNGLELIAKADQMLYVVKQQGARVFGDREKPAMPTSLGA
jgi:diguanylate cyclase (GGDEF)-like protein/PAS domain S-box-containing protein